jgi:hypothetical protein
MSHYRVFTANKRYGDGAWYWPSTSRLCPAVRWRCAGPPKRAAPSR